MCGISGIVDHDRPDVDRELLGGICDALVHRGPDDHGEHYARHVGLAHRRLSIIDLGDSGRQPLSNEDDTIWVVCNGEIYNFRDLRRQLRDLGHEFRSGTDVETLVHGYEQWGMERLLDRVAGMFAFALWDASREVLWLVRDRLGVKPLYYVRNAAQVVFSSEIQPLYRLVEMNLGALDKLSLDYYLSQSYVPPDRTIVKGIDKVPPAHWLRFDRSGMEACRYWHVRYGAGAAQANGSAHADELVHPAAPGHWNGELERLDSLLQAAVHRRLESDVPLGVFLSAGIDSCLVTAMAAKQTSDPLRTYTVGFEGVSGKDDECAGARLVADMYGTRHEEIVVPGADRDTIDDVLTAAGEPFGDNSLLPSHLVCRHARPSVTVALTGDGGDESFCGYRHVHVAYLGFRVRSVTPAKVLSGLERAGRKLGPAATGVPGVRELLKAVKYARISELGLFDRTMWWNDSARRPIYAPAWADALAPRQALDVLDAALQESGTEEFMSRILSTDLRTQLPGAFLTKMDIASNMVALEIRSPFVDHRLVEYAAGLPVSLKMRMFRQKAMLRKLASRYLPARIVRRRKTGFSAPRGPWRQADWNDLVRDYVTGGIAQRRDVFQEAPILQVAREHASGKANHMYKLWTLVCLEHWLRTHIDGNA